MTPRSMPHEFVQLQTTLDDRKQAEELIRDAVECRLAACGQLLGPVNSTYRWNGAIEEASEWLCVFKTTGALAPALERWIAEPCGRLSFQGHHTTERAKDLQAKYQCGKDPA